MAYEIDSQGLSLSPAVNIKDKSRTQNGAFRARCGFGEMKAIDPAVYPGASKAPHMHAFFGGSSVTPYTSRNDLLSTGSTCAGQAVNRSLYWIPTMLEDVGGRTRTVEFSDFLAYYKSSINKFKPNNTNPYAIFPSRLSNSWLRLEMVAHQGENQAEWRCDGNNTAYSSMPTHCKDKLNVQFWFPQCLNTGAQPENDDAVYSNGKSRYHSATDQAKWLRYADKRRYSTANGCPSGWERIPGLSLSVSWKVSGNSNMRSWRLSSDHGARPGSTIHGDFINGWDPNRAQEWYSECLLPSRDCTDVLRPGNTAACRSNPYSAQCQWPKLYGGTNLLFTNR